MDTIVDVVVASLETAILCISSYISVVCHADEDDTTLTSVKSNIRNCLGQDFIGNIMKLEDALAIGPNRFLNSPPKDSFAKYCGLTDTLSSQYERAGLFEWM